MVNKNLANLTNNKKPVELVQELKDEYQVLSYEEFMKTYESDNNLNYDDLSGGDISEVKGYGPCSSCSGSNRNLKFKLEITLKSCMGSWRKRTVYNINNAREQARQIAEESAGHWEDGFLDYFSQEDRRKLARKINEKIDYHREGNKVDTSVCNKNEYEFDPEFEAEFISTYNDPDAGLKF